MKLNAALKTIWGLSEGTDSSSKISVHDSSVLSVGFFSMPLAYHNRISDSDIWDLTAAEAAFRMHSVDNLLAMFHTNMPFFNCNFIGTDIKIF